MTNNMKYLLLAIFFFHFNSYSQIMKPIFKKLRIKQAKILIDNYAGHLSTDLDNKFHIKAYVLNNKEVVVDFETHAFEFLSEEDLECYIKNLRAKASASQPIHFLKQFIPDKDKFLKDVSQSINYINKIFKLKDSIPSLLGLIQIDSQYNTRYDKKKAKLFSCLVAYVGEAMINEIGQQAEWCFKKGDDGEDFLEPYVKKGNFFYNPFLPVYKEVFEEFPETKQFALYDHIKIELMK